jgi:ApaG protein
LGNWTGVVRADQRGSRERAVRVPAAPLVANESERQVQLRSRHWIITDGFGRVEEVRGKGVVGEQPTLAPGESFQYTSGCVLETPHGTMHGTYQMEQPDGSTFDAEISPFVLATPTAQAKRVLN